MFSTSIENFSRQDKPRCLRGIDAISFARYNFPRDILQARVREDPFYTYKRFYFGKAEMVHEDQRTRHVISSSL